MIHQLDHRSGHQIGLIFYCVTVVLNESILIILREQFSKICSVKEMTEIFSRAKVNTDKCSQNMCSIALGRMPRMNFHIKVTIEVKGHLYEKYLFGNLHEKMLIILQFFDRFS